MSGRSSERSEAAPPDSESLSPRQLRIFKIRKSHKSEEKSDSIDHGGVVESKSHSKRSDDKSTSEEISSVHDPTISSLSNKPEVKGEKSKTNDESTVDSISEHIEKQDESIEEVISNRDSSHRQLSIPSLHLSSLSKSDSEYDEESERNAENSNNDDSPFSKKSSGPTDSLEKLINSSNDSFDKNEKSENVKHISNESSIHTLFDLVSSRSSNDVNESSNSGKKNMERKKTNIEDAICEENPNSPLRPESNADSPDSNRRDKNEKENDSKDSSTSEEIIKVDIRGTASKVFPLASKMLFFNNMTPIRTGNFIPLSDKLVNLATLNVVPQLQNNPIGIKTSPTSNSEENEPELICDINKTTKNTNEFEQDCAIEEMILNESRNMFPSKDNEENVFSCNASTKPNADGDTSLSTVATEYKTLCDDYQKISDIQEVLQQREALVDELKSTLTDSIKQREKLQTENEYLSDEVGKLQQLLSDVTSTNGEMKGHLSDFVKHENLVNDVDPETLPPTMKIFDKVSKENYTQTEDSRSDVDSNDNQKIPIDATDYVKPVIFLSGFDDFQNNLSCDEASLFQKLKEKITKLVETELHNKYEMFLADISYLKDKLSLQESNNKVEQKRLRDILLSLKTDNPEISQLRNEMEIKHQKEMEDLRTYFEQKCLDMEKHYSEEIFSQQSKKMSADSSMDSLNNCPEALPFGSPFHRGKKPEKNHKSLRRSHSLELPIDSNKNKNFNIVIKDLKSEHHAEIENINKSHQVFINELLTSHENFKSQLVDYKQQIADLKADLQTYQNTEINLGRYDHRDTDLELEKKDNDVLLSACGSSNNRKDTETQCELLDEVLLSDPNGDLTNWPLNLISLKNKIEAETQQTIEQLKMTHAQELASLREENEKQVALETQKYAAKEEEWRLKRYEAFDKNRHLEDVVKERDGLKRMIITLQKVLSQLVEYFNLCEDELNNTVIGELLKQIMLADENFDDTLILNCTIKTDGGSVNQTLNEILDENDHSTSILTQLKRKMHFTPDVNEIMTYIDTSNRVDDLDQSHDISLNFKHNLDVCLKRLRTEAQELLALSETYRAPKRLSILGSEENQRIRADETVEVHKENKNDYDYDELRDLYEKSEVARKELEESLAQSMYQEVVLKGELQMAMDKIAELMNDSLPNQNKEVISEGYGIVTHPRTPVSLPPHPRVAITSPPPILGSEGNTPEGSQCLSLDAIQDKRASNNHEVVRRLTCEIETTTKEKEDIQMQLEAANKQLRSTRQFLEEQAAEREQERDEFQQQLEQLKEENSKLSNKTQHHTRMCKESSDNTQLHTELPLGYVEQLDNQIREMTTLINDLENQKSNLETELKATVDKTLLLRDIIGNLESQLESKTTDETNILKELLHYKEIVEEKELKMGDMSSELEKLKNDLTDRIAADALLTGERNANNIAAELEMEKRLVEQMRGQLEVLVETLTEHTNALENLHEAVCSQSCSSPSEDVSVHKRNTNNADNSIQVTIPASPNKLMLQLPLLEISRLGDSVNRHLKAEDAALKRIRDLEMQLIQLKDVAQELRAERDILQDRMSEQSMRISSLQSRLDQTRHTAEQIRHQSTEDLRLQLDEALSEIQLLKESLDSRDKQVARFKSLLEKKKIDDDIDISTDSNKEAINKLNEKILELESKNKELQESLENNKAFPEFLESILANQNADINLLKKQLLEKEKHLLKLNFEEDDFEKNISQHEKDENHGKLSARTLSDVLSISEFDEPDVMRRAEIIPQNMTENLQPSFKNKDITNTPDLEKIVPIMASSLLQITEDKILVTDIDVEKKKDDNSHGKSVLDMYTRKMNETTLFGASHKSDHLSVDKKSDLNENCSMFPNKDASDNRNITVEPKKIDFSGAILDESDNRIKERVAEILESFKAIGIDINTHTNNYVEVLNEIKGHVYNMQKELETKQSSLKLAQKQLDGIPVIQKEMNELKTTLQSSVKKMDDDKQYYNAQLDKFVTNEQSLKQQLQQAIDDVNEKTKELQILKEDIVRRENIVLEFAKEKRRLQQALHELESKVQLSDQKEGGSLENNYLKEKLSDMHRLETLLSEKNQQIDSLNIDLDRLDDVQRELDEKKAEIEQLHAVIEEKSGIIENVTKINESLLSNERYLVQEKSQLANEVKNLQEINVELENEVDKYKDSLSKLEGDLINISQKTLDKHLHSNGDFIQCNVRVEDLKLLLDEIDSPRSQGSNSQKYEKLDLNRIKNHIMRLQTEINFTRKELSGKVFELERAKLEIIDMKAQGDNLTQHLLEREKIINEVTSQKTEYEYTLKKLMSQLQEEGNLEELRTKFNRKVEECNELEQEIISLKLTVERVQKNAHFNWDKDKQTQELSMENNKLKQHIVTLENKVVEQENIISELNDVKENLVADIQDLEEKSEAEKDTSARLQILLDTEKQTANNIQSQDSNVIQILKGRLEVALDSESELKMLLEREKKSAEQSSKQIESLRKQLEHLRGGQKENPVIGNSSVQLQEELKSVSSQLEDQMEINELLKSENMVLKTKRDREKSRLLELQNVLDREKLWFQKEIDASKEQCSNLKHELDELMRQKHEMHLELVHSREKLHLQKNEILSLEKRLALLQDSQKSLPKSESYKMLLNDLEQQKNDLYVEVSTLKHNLELAVEREKKLHMILETGGHGSGKTFDSETSTLHYLKEMQTLLKRHINENVQISETVKELTQERRDLQLKVKQLENQMKLGALRHTTSLLNLPEGVDQQVRFLYGRFMRMQSYRKALVWQKRYLGRIVSSFEEWQIKLGIPVNPTASKGIKRWKCVIVVIRSVFRMKYLVRRWQTGSKLAANIHLNIPNVYPTDLRSCKSYTHIPSSPTSREKTATRSRLSLNNPSTSHHSPTSKHANKSWSMGSGVNLTQNDRHLLNRQVNFVTHQPPFRSNLMYRDNGAFSDIDRWNSGSDHHLSGGSHQELPQFLEENFDLRSATTENDGSSIGIASSKRFTGFYR